MIHALNLNAAKGTNEQKVGDFYASAMDSSAIEQKGISPLQQDMQRIAAIQNANDVLHEVAAEYNTGLSPMFSFYANQDDKNSNAIVAHFDQGGLGFPTKIIIQERCCNGKHSQCLCKIYRKDINACR